MAGSLSFVDEAWSDEGWPYPDSDEESEDTEVTDHDADIDDDLVSVHALEDHLLDDLEPVERQVVAARFGLDGRPALSMKEIQRELSMPRDEVRVALGDGLAKLRKHLD